MTGLAWSTAFPMRLATPRCLHWQSERATAATTRYHGANGSGHSLHRKPCAETAAPPSPLKRGSGIDEAAQKGTAGPTENYTRHSSQAFAHQGRIAFFKRSDTMKNHIIRAAAVTLAIGTAGQAAAMSNAVDACIEKIMEVGGPDAQNGGEVLDTS